MNRAGPILAITLLVLTASALAWGEDGGGTVKGGATTTVAGATGHGRRGASLHGSSSVLPPRQCAGSQDQEGNRKNRSCAVHDVLPSGAAKPIPCCEERSLLRRKGVVGV